MSRRLLRLAFAFVLAAGLPFGGTAASIAGSPNGPGAGHASLLAGIPKNPAGAAVALVDTIVGGNAEEAEAATTELLRLSGIPVVRAEGDVVALPNDVTYLDATFYAELVPGVRDTVARGVFLTPDQFVGYLVAVKAMPDTFPSEDLVGGLGTWGKDPDSIPEEKAAAAAIRALSASRGEVLYREASMDEIHLDLLQLLLVMAVLSQSGGNVAAADPTKPLTGTTGGASGDGDGDGDGGLAALLGVGEASAATPCERLENAMKDNPNLAWKAAKKGAKKSAKALIKQWQKSDPAGRAQRVYTKATEIQDEYGEIWSKGGDIVNVAMLLLGAKLEVNGDPEFLHVMPEGGKPIVTVTATATFESDLAQERLPCYAMAGISVPPNGPMSGFRIRWSITQPVGGVGLGQGKFLKIPTGQAQAFQTTGGGGQITGSDGKAKVTLDVAHERDPGVGKKQKGKVWVRATLDKDDFPFKMSDAWSFWNPGWAGEKIWELILSAASRLGLPSQPVLITVEYHDNEPYSIKGTRRIFGFYYIIPIELDLYTCEGLDGPWHGTVKFHGDRDFLGDAANKVFGRHFPMTVDQSWSTNFTPRFGQNALGQANPSTMVTLVGPLNGLIDIDTGWRALQRTQGAVIGTMTLMGEAGGELEALAFFDGFDLSYPIKVGAPAHCPPGGLYFP